MLVLVLTLVVAIVGTFTAVPLFEFVFASLLLTPLLKFLLASVLGWFGQEIVGGAAEQVFYLFCFGVVALSAYLFLGPRRGKLSLSDWYPLCAFAGIYTLAYALCHQWVEFYDLGERLRDYALLGSAISSPVIPKEPWMEGATLNYYVFWYRFGSMLSRILGMSLWDTYHAVMAFSMGFYAAVIFQIVRVVFGGSVPFAIAGALLIPFGPNVAGMLILKRGANGSFETDEGWWGPSRIVQGAIDEFPAWSFVLGDAHPHYLNLAAFPFFLLILYSILTAPAASAHRAIHALAFVVSAVLFLAGSNAWEVPMWLGTAALIGLSALVVFRAPVVATTRDFVSRWISKEPQNTFDVIKQISCVGLVLASIVFVAFNHQNRPGWISASIVAASIGFGIVFWPRNAARPSLSLSKRVSSRGIAWGVFWVLLVVALKLSCDHIKPEGGSLEFVRSPIPVTTTKELFGHWGSHLVLLAGASLLLRALSLRTGVMVAFLLCALFYDKGALFLYSLIGVQLIRVTREREGKGSWREAFAEAIVIASLGLILLPEVVFLNDSYGPEIERMNTIFKIYVTAWVLSGLSVLYLVERVWRRAMSEDLRFAHACLGAMVLIILVGGTARFYSHVLPMRFMDSDSRFGSEGLTLANRKYPGSAAIIQMLRKQPYGRVLETQGKPYSFTCFVSTLAGQPAYLGWANHVNLLTRLGDEIGRRTKVTDDMYKQADCATRRQLAQSEKIKYVVVGSLEREKYPGVADLDFSCFSRLAQSEQYALYQSW